MEKMFFEHNSFFNGNVDANIGLLGLLLTKYTIFYDLERLFGVGDVVDP